MVIAHSPHADQSGVASAPSIQSTTMEDGITRLGKWGFMVPAMGTPPTATIFLANCRASLSLLNVLVLRVGCLAFSDASNETNHVALVSRPGISASMPNASGADTPVPKRPRI